MANKHATALGQALESKGYLARNVEFQVAISKFQNGGGEYGVALAMLNAAYGRGAGHVVRDADGVLTEVAGASPDSKQAQGGRLPVRPGHARRGAAAIDSVQATIAKSLFDSIVLPDGRRLREVRWSEAPILAAKYQRVSRILLACRNYAIPTDPAATLDQVVPEGELATIVQAVERLNALD